MMNLAIALVLGQGTLANDPRLEKVVGFDALITPMASFMDIAQGASGVALDVDPSLEYLKVDAFVDGQPIGVTLDKLAEVFGAKWKVVGSGYTLVPDPKAVADEQAYINDENNEVVRVVDREIAIYREIDRLIPKSDKPWVRNVNRFEAWVPRRDAVLADLEMAKENSVAADKITALDIHYEALKQISEGFPNLQLARLFGLMRPDEIAQFRSGTPFIASNQGTSRFKYSLGDIKPNEDMRISNSVRSIVVARVDPDSHRVGYKEMTYLGNAFAVAAEPPPHYPFDEISPSLVKKPFAVALNDWDQSRSFSKTFSDAISSDTEDMKDVLSPWYGKRRRLGDHLRWFHQVTDIPVIAPADRITHPFIRSYRAAKSQGDYLSKLMTACKGYGRKSGDFLLVRDGVYWRKLAHELPEEVLSRFEHPKQGKLTFADYAELATKISHTQAMLLEDSHGYVLKFPRFRFAEAYPALKFLNSLSPDQIADACEVKKGLPFQTLLPEQKSLFSFAVTEGVADRGFASDPMLTTLVYTGFQPDTLTMMKFFIRDTIISASYSSETVNEDGIPMELVPKLSFPKRRTKIFEFSYLLGQSNVSYATEDIGLF
jgi:hypothetical protein